MFEKNVLFCVWFVGHKIDKHMFHFIDHHSMVGVALCMSGTKLNLS